MTESASSYLSSEPGASAGINTPSSFKHYKSFHSIKESIDFDVQYKTEAARIQSLEKIDVIKVIIVKLESSGISEFQCNIERCMAQLSKDSNTTRWEKILADC